MGKALGLKPRAKILGGASIGSEPSIMLTGPELVTQKLMKKLGLSKQDIDLWELNEAFASVVLRWVQALDLDMEKVNVNGGAIAMGHPIGATGAMILGTMVDELERADKERALDHALHRRRHGHRDGDRAGELMRALALFALVLLTAAPAAAQQQPALRAPVLRPPAVQPPPAQPPQHQQGDQNDQRDSISGMNAEDMYWMREFMRRKREREEAISDSMREASESEDTITANTKDE